MVKRGKPYFFIALIVVVIVLIINAAFLINNSGGLPNGITGFSVNENLLNSFGSLPQGGKVFIISEVSLLFLMLIIVLVRDITIKKYKTEVIEVHIKRNIDPTKTDIDVLYDALKDKKELTISTISKAFDVDKDTVVGWAQILESGGLAIIEYPGFSEPIVRLTQKEIKTISTQKHDLVEDSKKIKKEIIGKKHIKKSKKKHEKKSKIRKKEKKKTTKKTKSKKPDKNKTKSKKPIKKKTKIIKSHTHKKKK
ncbi:hypothetical protein GOV12_08255 [Candidatus Pacearchaeota archaeon]|nr:hypothetical protein [Candidatus Pacearchaeota archaeon]